MTSASAEECFVSIPFECIILLNISIKFCLFSFEAKNGFFFKCKLRNYDSLGSFEMYCIHCIRTGYVTIEDYNDCICSITLQNQCTFGKFLQMLTHFPKVFYAYVIHHQQHICKKYLYTKCFSLRDYKSRRLE